MSLHQVTAISALMVASFFGPPASAQQVLKVSQNAWATLTLTERDLIQKAYVVSMVAPETFGVIIDNQGVNESTSGTNGGAALGGALANAAYIDNAFRGGNYSAVNQLAVGLLGAVIGSSLDSAAQARYHYRYAVKLGHGAIQYFDEVSADPFRHPAGVCVSVPAIALTDQQLCTQTADSLRSAYLRIPVAPAPAPAQAMVAPLVIMSSASPQPTEQAGQNAAISATVTINCKLGSLAPVRTSPEKCELIKGSQVQ